MTDHHIPEPPQVERGRERMLAGERLPENQNPMREYYCRHCGSQERGRWVPRGWYALTRRAGSNVERPQRLGLFCSARCIVEHAERLIGIEDDLGDRFDTAPSSFRQVPTR